MHQELAERFVVVCAVLHVPHDILDAPRVLGTGRVEAAAVGRPTSPPPRIEEQRAVRVARPRIVQALEPRGGFETSVFTALERLRNIVIYRSGAT